MIYLLLSFLLNLFVFILIVIIALVAITILALALGGLACMVSGLVWLANTSIIKLQEWIKKRLNK